VLDLTVLRRAYAVYCVGDGVDCATAHQPNSTTRT